MAFDAAGHNRAMRALLLTFSWQELRHHPWRNAAAVVAVMLGVALAFSVHLINQSALSEFGAAVRSVNGQPDFELRGQRDGYDEMLYARVAKHPQVALASPVIEIDTYALARNGERVPLRLLGLDALVAAPLWLGDGSTYAGTAFLGPGLAAWVSEPRQAPVAGPLAPPTPPASTLRHWGPRFAAVLVVSILVPCLGRVI